MKGLLLADIDGTLVDAMGRLWPESLSIGQVAEDLDCQIALCSGRPVWSVTKLAERLGRTVTFAASFQGAMISQRIVDDECPAWEVLTTHFLERNLEESIESLIESTDSFWLFTDTDWYVRSIDEAALAEYRAVGVRWSNGMRSIMKRLIKIVIVHKGSNNGLVDYLRSAELPASFSPSQAGYIEIVASKAGEDKGASFIINLLATENQSFHTISIGDSFNDLGMLDAADTAITFTDAPLEIRNAADIILPSDRHVALNQLATILAEVLE